MRMSAWPANSRTSCIVAPLPGPAHTQNEHRLVKMPFSRAATGDF